MKWKRMEKEVEKQYGKRLEIMRVERRKNGRKEYLQEAG